MRPITLLAGLTVAALLSGTAFAQVSASAESEAKAEVDSSSTAYRLTDIAPHDEVDREDSMILAGHESVIQADQGKLDGCGKGCGGCQNCGSGLGSGLGFGYGDRITNVGGELRFRYHDEQGMFGGRFTDAKYDSLLTRLRLWGDVIVNDNVTFHVEGIYADSSTDDGFRPIDRNRGDVRNMYFDVAITDSLTARVGRQDFLYGAQRVVSPLDWANTRRAFDGVKTTYTGVDLWNWDFFYGNLVNVQVDQFDRSNYDVSLYGAYGVYSGLDVGDLDVYYIGYDNQALGFSRHNLGTRVNGSRDRWLYELEGAFQFGDDNGDDVTEGFFTLGAGRKMDHCWNPVLWGYFDYATGDDGNVRMGNVGQDEFFPLTHKYLGFIDSVLRSNVIAPNVLFTFEPMEHTKFLIWYYHFRAENDGVVIPGVGNAPQSVGAGNRVLGNELDLLGNFQLTDNSSLLIGFSQFWRGNRITGNNDAQFLYGQYTIKF